MLRFPLFILSVLLVSCTGLTPEQEFVEVVAQTLCATQDSHDRIASAQSSTGALTPDTLTAYADETEQKQRELDILVQHTFGSTEDLLAFGRTHERRDMLLVLAQEEAQARCTLDEETRSTVMASFLSF